MAIENHKWDMIPKTNEGLVVKDADKLAWIGKGRWETCELLRNLGIKIKHIVIPGRAHNNNSGIGVNEIGDKIVNDSYKSSIDSKKIDDELAR